MSSVNAAMDILARSVVTRKRILQQGLVRVRRGKIAEVREGIPGAEEVAPGFLIPGLIDIHTNGAFGVDFSRCNSRQLTSVSRQLSSCGCTSFLPTLISAEKTRLEAQLARLADAMSVPMPGAQPLGIHLEGPFLNPTQAGAHPVGYLLSPSLELTKTFDRASDGRIRVLTLAPELAGATELIAAYRERFTLLAGHSQASFEEMSRGIELGIRGATHTYNAMAPLHHRDPGLLAAILNRSEIFAEIIADGHHVHPTLLELLVRCKGSRRVVLVTDATSAAGMPDGEYQLGDLTISRVDGICRNQKGILAGSSLLPDEGMRNLWNWLGAGSLKLRLEEIVWMTSGAPAELLNLKSKGRIETGCDADLVLLDEKLRVRKTWVKGRLVFDADWRM